MCFVFVRCLSAGRDIVQRVNSAYGTLSNLVFLITILSIFLSSSRDQTIIVKSEFNFSLERPNLMLRLSAVPKNLMGKKYRF